MIKYVTPLLLIIFSTVCFSQKEIKKSIWVCDTTLIFVKKMGGFVLTDSYIVEKRDHMGRELEKVYQKLDVVTKKLKNYKKEVNKYNNQGKKIELINLCWVENKNKWIPILKKTYEYSTFDIVKETTFRKNACKNIVSCGNGKLNYSKGIENDIEKLEWLDVFKWEYSYNESQSIIIENEYSKCYLNLGDYNIIYMGIWSEPIDSIHYKYINNKKSEIFEKYQTALMPKPKYTKQTYEYDSENKEKTMSDYSFDNKNKAWKTMFVKEYEYNEKGILTEENKIKNGYTADRKWKVTNREVINYDSNKNISKKTYLLYDPFDELWIEDQSYKYIYEYDQNGNLIKEAHKEKLQNTWTDLFVYEYYYDDFNNMIKRIFKNKIKKSLGLQVNSKIEYKFKQYYIN